MHPDHTTTLAYYHTTTLTLPLTSSPIVIRISSIFLDSPCIWGTWWGRADMRRLLSPTALNFTFVRSTVGDPLPPPLAEESPEPLALLLLLLQLLLLLLLLLEGEDVGELCRKDWEVIRC